MKIEILKITNLEDETFYWIVIDGNKITCHTDLKDAERVFDKLVNKEEPKTEVIKSIEI